MSDWIPVESIKWRRLAGGGLAAVRCGHCGHDYAAQPKLLEQYRQFNSPGGLLSRTGRAMMTWGLSGRNAAEQTYLATALRCPSCGVLAPHIRKA